MSARTRKTAQGLESPGRELQFSSIKTMWKLEPLETGSARWAEDQKKQDRKRIMIRVRCSLRASSVCESKDVKRSKTGHREPWTQSSRRNMKSGP